MKNARARGRLKRAARLVAATCFALFCVWVSTFTVDAADEGAILYGVHCSSCHGTDLKGSANVPSLQHAGGASVDFYLTTGRMPLADIEPGGTQAYHSRPILDTHQIAALEAYVDANVEHALPIPKVRLDSSQLSRGRQLFENNCEACHGAAAEGATAGYQWTALSLSAATPTQIGEAIRIGPGVMPRFTSAQLSDNDIGAVATYVRYLATEPQTYGGTVMDYLGPAAEGAVGGLIGVGFLFWVVYFTGTKADGRRVHERD
ncbi:MAG TPA: c-type cytochrome [Candidatus Baltobacteraceae bacterium]|nr:c-type cytochrome [Candidatus Baltobacteraceae bacterium]